MAKGQLHELLAVEADLRNLKEKERDETIQDFAHFPNKFQGAVKVLKMLDESRVDEEVDTFKEIECTVPERLVKVSGAFVRYWDLRLQKESANQKAAEDVVLDGKVLFPNVPVTFLLNMEEELRQIRKVYAAAPTLEPTKTWVEDSQKGHGYYKTAYKEEKTKTERTVNYKVLVQPTQYHPAQVEKWSEDKVIGKYITETWSGMISPVDKSIFLSRIDKLLKAFKEARQRANCTTTEPREIGNIIFDYIYSR